MKHKILPILIAATALTGCSTIYKSGQTPDDVYYSPLKKYEEKKDEDKREEQAQTEEQQQEQRQQSVVRYGVTDRRWRDVEDDWDYDRYNHRCNCYCNTYGYGYYNNPYFTPRPYFYPTYVPRSFNPVVNNTPRMVNLQAYKPAPATNYAKGDKYRPSLNSRRTYNNSNSAFGNAIRRIISPSGSSSQSESSGSSNNNRTYSPSNSGSSSSGSSSGGSSGGGSSVSRPGRGG